MQLTFLGGADEVGASSTLVHMGGKTILVDAGIRISPRTSRGIQADQLPDLSLISEAGGPDYILVTHAHTDHTRFTGMFQKAGVLDAQGWWEKDTWHESGATDRLGDNIEIIPTPGNHANMLSLPHVEKLGAAIKKRCSSRINGNGRP